MPSVKLTKNTTVVRRVVSTKPNPKLTLLFRRNQLVMVPRGVSAGVPGDSDLGSKIPAVRFSNMFM